MRYRYLLFPLLVSACAPHAGPDKTVAGGLLGAAWGAGTGAVIGHQLSYTGEGAAIGAGFGLVSGLATGAPLDAQEGEVLRQEQELEALRVQNEANARELEQIQARLDFPPASLTSVAFPPVYFDPDATSLRAGSFSALEVIADAIKRNPYARTVVIRGHSDDAGTPEYNARIAEARARSVLSYLASRGVATDQMRVEAHGSTRAVTSNATAEGRQLNRRVEIVVLP